MRALEVDRTDPVGLIDQALTLGRSGPALLRAMLDLIGQGVEIRVRDDIETAALIPTDGGFEVALGARAFAPDPANIEYDKSAFSLRDPRDILYVIAHELAHLIRDPHVLPDDPRRAMVANVAADALNDAWLTGPAFSGFFCPQSELPARRPTNHPINALMVPLPAASAFLPRPEVPPLSPQVSRRFFEEVVTPPPSRGRSPYCAEDWARVHHALQCGGRDDELGLDLAMSLVDPLIDQLPEERPAHAEAIAALVRAHDTPSSLRHRAALRRSFEAACDGRGANRGGSPSAARGRMTVRRVSPVARLEGFLRRFVSELDDLGVYSPSGRGRASADFGPLIAPRALAEYAAEIRATPFAEMRPEGGLREARVEVYLDTSGSMHDALPHIVASVAARCAELIQFPLRTFSVGVHPLSLAALRSNALPTDGGTSFEALANDLLARRVSRAVVISDGEARALPDALRERLRCRHIQVAQVFPGHIGESPLDALCPPSWRLALNL